MADVAELPAEQEAEEHEEIEVVVDEEVSASKEASPEKSSKDEDPPADGDDLDPNSPGYYKKLRERETPEETEARRKADRQRRKTRREEFQRRLQEENIALKRNLAEVQERVTRVESRSVNADFARIDAAINNASAEIAAAQRAMEEAVAVGDGKTVTAAVTNMYQAQKAVEELTAFKKQAQQQQQRPPQAAQLDPVVKNYGEAWMREHPWYNPQGADEDSAIVLAIDARLTQEGLDPRKKDYWDELTRRVKRRVPDKHMDDSDFDDDPEPAPRKKSPVAGSGRDSGGTTKNVIRISPERKAELVKLGVWDDPKQRLEYVKYFQKYDADHGRK
jgi:hypothetical protein